MILLSARQTIGEKNVKRIYVAKATYIRLLHGKIAFFVFFGLSSVKRGRTHTALGRNM